MYEKVLSALQAQLQNSRQPRLRRSTWSDQGDENDSHLVSSLAVDLGASHHRDFAASLKYERHSTDLISEGWSTGDIHDHLLARAFDSVTARPWDSIVIPLLWDQIVAPPYDAEWQEGGGLAFGAKFDGKVYTLPSASGSSNAGVGFHLSSDIDVAAEITPIGDYNWNSFCLTSQPAVRSRGGISLAVFRDGNAQPVVQRNAMLWNIAGVPAYYGAQGSGRIAVAASPAIGFGTVPIGPTWIDMAAGSDYLIWIWCWQMGVVPENSGFWAYLGYAMPMVTVNFEPPFVGPH